MTKLQYYLFKKFIFSIVISFLPVFILLLFLQLIKLFDIVVNNGVSISSLIYISTLGMSVIATEIFPFTSLIGISYVFFSINHNNELTIMRTVGMSSSNILKPLIIIAIMLSILMFFMNFYVIPNSERLYRNILFKISHNYNIKMIEVGKFVSLNNNSIIYVEKIQAGEFHNILIYQNNIVSHEQKFIVAKTGYIDTDENDTIIILLSDTVINIVDNNNNVRYFTFDKYILDIDTFVEARAYFHPKELVLPKLFKRFLQDKGLYDKSKQNEELFYLLNRTAKLIIRKAIYTIIPFMLILLTGYFFLLMRFSRINNILPTMYVFIFTIVFKVFQLYWQRLYNIHYMYDVFFFLAIFLAIIWLIGKIYFSSKKISKSKYVKV